MTNELSVEEAIELLKEKRMEINYQVNGTTQFSEALDMGIKVLEQEPKTGHWVVLSEGFSPYGCSKCGGVEFKKSNYCPNCGARMESEDSKCTLYRT